MAATLYDKWRNIYQLDNDNQITDCVALAETRDDRGDEEQRFFYHVENSEK